jgi:hypothetical protein
MTDSRIAWIEPDRVIHGNFKTLLAAKIPFCSFDGNVSQEKLDLVSPSQTIAWSHWRTARLPFAGVTLPTTIGRK